MRTEHQGVIFYPSLEQRATSFEDPIYPVINERQVGTLYTQTGRQLGERYSLDQILELTRFVSQFTHQQEYMATKSVPELWPYIHGSRAFPWVIDTHQGPEVLAFAKLNPWDVSAVAAIHESENGSSFFDLSAGQVMEVSTFFVNPFNRPEYKGLGSVYIHHVLRAAYRTYPTSTFIAVVQVENDKACRYFESVGGIKTHHFWYEHTLAEGVKGEKVLFNLTSVARAVSLDHSSTH
jgi:hypothetical protein